MLLAGRPQLVGVDAPSMQALVGSPVSFDPSIVGQPDVAALPLLAAGEWRVELFLRTWTDVTADVRELSVDRGSRATGGITRATEAGTASVTLANRSRQYDPSINTDLYTGTPARITCSNGVSMVEVLTGRVVQIDMAFLSSGLDATVTLSMADAVSVLSQRNLAQLAVAVGAGDTVSQRIARILDAVGWPTALRDLSAGGAVLAATTYGGSAWDLITEVVDAEVGDVWVSPAGVVTFRTFVEALSGAAEATFSDNGTGLEFADIAVVYDDDSLVNQVQYALAGSPTVTTLTDNASVTKYTADVAASLSATELPFSTQAAADAWASLALYVLSEPELRVDSLSVLPRASSALVGPTLALDVSDRVNVVLSPIGGGTFSQSCWVRGISHTVSADRTWSTTLRLGSAARYRFFTFDDVELAQLDRWALTDAAGTFTGGRYVATAGNVVPRSDLNKLADQMVMVFDSAAARSAAIPSPTEGMVSYRRDVKKVQVYNGTTWV